MNENLESFPIYQNEFNQLIQMISTGKLKSADGIQVIDPKFPLIKHYFTYAYTDTYGYTWFFVAYAGINEIKLLREDQIVELADKYRIGKIIPFYGYDFERSAAIERGHEIVGKKYHWIGRNCENVMNYIQTGKSFSNQTRAISTGVMLGGIVVASSSKNKTVRTVAGIFSIAAIVSLFIDLLGENNP